MPIILGFEGCDWRLMDFSVTKKQLQLFALEGKMLEVYSVWRMLLPYFEFLLAPVVFIKSLGHDKKLKHGLYNCLSLAPVNMTYLVDKMDLINLEILVQT